MQDMATNPVYQVVGGSFLLQLLYFAGWRLQVRDGQPARVRARRANVDLDVTGASVEQAARIVFARAMRSGKRDDRPEGG
jgi:hypothetical protein